MPLGFAPSNNGPIGSAAGGLGQVTPDSIQAEKLQRLLMQVQAYQAAQPMIQGIQNQANQSPQNAQDPQLIKILQGLYKQAGMGQAPITPATQGGQIYDPGSSTMPGPQGTPSGAPGQGNPYGQGVTPINDQSSTQGRTVQTQAVPESIDTSRMGSGSDFQWIQANMKELAQLTPEQRLQRANAAGINLSDRARDALLHMAKVDDPKLQDAKEKNFYSDFDKQLKIAVDAGPGQIEAVVKSFSARAKAQLGMSDEEIQAEFAPYLSSAAEQMTPSNALKLSRKGVLDQQSDWLRESMNDRLQLLQETIKERHEQTQHLQDLQDNWNKMFPANYANKLANTKKLIADAEQDRKRGDQLEADASYYRDRAGEIVQNKNSDPRRWVAAVNATRAMIENSNNIVERLQAANTQFQGALASTDSTVRRNAEYAISQNLKTIQVEQAKSNTYNNSLQTLLGQYGSGVGSVAPFDTTNDPANPQGDKAPPVTTYRDGQLYYMWPDGNWHTKKPE